MTDTKKQTAVEWLSKRLHNRRNGIYDGHPDLSVQQLCEIALIMEREQIEDAYCNGVIDGVGQTLNRDRIKPDAVKYYNDNHGKEAQP